MFKDDLEESYLNCSHDKPLEDHLLDAEKIDKIEYHFREILLTLGMDMDNPSLKKTPHRVAKMFINELFQGLSSPFPTITMQENTFTYEYPLIESYIRIESLCEHHFVPIIGYCHIAYIPKKHIIGLSKLHRIADHIARRPQLQERMTKEICSTLSHVLETPDVAVVVDALHLCVRMRGIRDKSSLTRTMDLSGAFLEDPIRRELFDSIPKLSDIHL